VPLRCLLTVGLLWNCIASSALCLAQQPNSLSSSPRCHPLASSPLALRECVHPAKKRKCVNASCEPLPLDSLPPFVAATHSQTASMAASPATQSASPPVSLLNVHVGVLGHVDSGKTTLGSSACSFVLCVLRLWFPAVSMPVHTVTDWHPTHNSSLLPPCGHTLHCACVCSPSTEQQSQHGRLRQESTEP
jgi:hypothetical protein